MKERKSHSVARDFIFFTIQFLRVKLRLTPNDLNDRFIRQEHRFSLYDKSHKSGGSEQSVG